MMHPNQSGFCLCRGAALLRPHVALRFSTSHQSTVTSHEPPVTSLLRCCGGHIFLSTFNFQLSTFCPDACPPISERSTIASLPIEEGTRHGHR